MKFDINGILDCIGESETLSTTVDLQDFHYRGVSPFNCPITLVAVASNRAGIITLECTYTYTLNLSCDRCLADYTQDVNQIATHTVVRTLNGSDDDDFVVTEDGIVELLSLATNDIILSLPSKFLCTDDCKGLCVTCGINLNTADCNCSAPTGDPRFAALDNFFKDE